MILAYFFPYKANAKREKPLIFTVDPNLQKPLIIYGPYEILPQKVNRPIPKKVSDKKTNQQPIKPIFDRNYGSGEIQDLIRKYAQQFGISSVAPLCIAKLESNFNPNAKNKSSSAGGVFQYLESTFRATDEGKAGHSRFEADANIRAAIKYMASRKNAKPWTVAPKCPPLQFL